jgi:hypothetical protein
MVFVGLMKGLVREQWMWEYREEMLCSESFGRELRILSLLVVFWGNWTCGDGDEGLHRSMVIEFNSCHGFHLTKSSPSLYLCVLINRDYIEFPMSVELYVLE